MPKYYQQKWVAYFEWQQFDETNGKQRLRPKTALKYFVFAHRAKVLEVSEGCFEGGYSFANFLFSFYHCVAIGVQEPFDKLFSPVLQIPIKLYSDSKSCFILW